MFENIYQWGGGEQGSIIYSPIFTASQWTNFLVGTSADGHLFMGHLTQQGNCTPNNTLSKLVLLLSIFGKICSKTF